MIIRATKLDLLKRNEAFINIGIKHFFSLLVLFLSCVGSHSQGISASDLIALRGATGIQGVVGNSVIGGASLPNLLAITVPAGNLQDDSNLEVDDKKQKKPLPLAPNEIQKYVLQTTGQALTLFGAEFFENLANNNGQFSRSPV